MLPNSRNTHYAPGTQIKSHDLNDLQDMIVGAKHGDKEILLSAATAETHSDGGRARFVGDHEWAWHSGIDVVHHGIPLHVGDRVKAVTIYGREGPANSYSVSLWRRDLTTGFNHVMYPPVGDRVSGTTGAFTSLVLDEADAAPLFILQDGAIYYARVLLTGPGVAYLGMKARYDRP
jgi:hypothetical protein